MPTVIIYWSPGRSEAQKAAVARQITTSLVEDAGAKQSDVLIVFQNILAGDSVRGSQIDLTGTDEATDNPPLNGLTSGLAQNHRALTDND